MSKINIIEENIKGNPKNEAEVKRILALLFTTPQTQVIHALMSLADMVAQVSAPDCKHNDTMILLSLAIIKDALERAESVESCWPVDLVMDGVEADQ